MSEHTEALDRRSFLRKIIGGGATAAAFGTVSYGGSLAISELSYSVEHNVDLDEVELEETRQFAIQEFKEKYQIPTLEQAQNLYHDANQEIAVLAATGAATGSVTRSAILEKKSELGKSFIGSLGISMAGLMAANPVGGSVLATRNTSLATNINLLQSKYGLSEENAIKFSETHTESIDLALKGGAIFSTWLPAWTGKHQIQEL